MTDKLTARIDELESQQAFQEELLDQLNDVVARQDRDIAGLRDKISELVDKLAEIGNALPGGGDGAADEVPPHY
jgi:SlyX protein